MQIKTLIVCVALATLLVVAHCAPAQNNANTDTFILIPVEAVQENADQDTAESRDLVASAGHHSYDVHGHLDKGAYTGHHGSFGWYADYPVGGGHHHHY
ncbi:uncharacterized protein LOC111622443 [Centruroides sculpturatus]|uniref:uncharacterized protein LOC111622443 n=1 Tax=Centruroides sculpturatus TaxID=218467 RepID=UPI000C6D1767|nr:uncharacterized protein LOC111622443 [Centruroides sculpturatus]